MTWLRFIRDRGQSPRCSPRGFWMLLLPAPLVSFRCGLAREPTIMVRVELIKGDMSASGFTTTGGITASQPRIHKGCPPDSITDGASPGVFPSGRRGHKQCSFLIPLSLLARSWGMGYSLSMARSIFLGFSYCLARSRLLGFSYCLAHSPF